MLGCHTIFIPVHRARGILAERACFLSFTSERCRLVFISCISLFGSGFLSRVVPHLARFTGRICSLLMLFMLLISPTLSDLVYFHCRFFLCLPW